MTIKDFFKQEHIQRYLEKDDLDSVYKEFPDTPVLTDFFIEKNIPYLEILETVPAYSHFRLPIETVSIPSNIIAIDNDAFSECPNLKELIFEDGCEYIGSFAFDGCAKLKNVVLPNTLKKISSYAFRDCTAIETITIPDNIEQVDFGAFDYCDNLKLFYRGDFYGRREFMQLFD